MKIQLEVGLLKRAVIELEVGGDESLTGIVDAIHDLRFEPGHSDPWVTLSGSRSQVKLVDERPGGRIKRYGADLIVGDQQLRIG